LGEGDPHFRASRLGQDHWNNIPAEYGLWNSYNHRTDRWKRNKIHSKIMLLLQRILPQCLTLRQYEVMRLCFLGFRCTQSAAAQLLGISQPTVSQHLNGKRRGGKKVGGACRRIRCKIRIIRVSQDWSVEEQQYLDYLQTLIQTDLSHRQRQRLYRTLS
jgi:predicted transcriptional regulator